MDPNVKETKKYIIAVMLNDDLNHCSSLMSY